MALTPQQLIAFLKSGGTTLPPPPIVIPLPPSSESGGYVPTPGDYQTTPGGPILNDRTSTPSSGGGGGGSTQPTTQAPTNDTGLTQEQLDQGKNILVPLQPIIIQPIGGLPYGPTINISPDIV